jgi:N-acetylglucosaminyldiphosphoundecaprenol N-acetyl-beta-D-mannosaminyltransferase
MPARHQPNEQPNDHVLDLRVDRLDYDQCVDRILAAAQARRFMAVAPANVHVVMEARRDEELARLLADFEMVVADGQPVRWMLNAIKAGDERHLDTRVYGPELMRRVARSAAQERLPVYLYGATESTLAALAAKLRDPLAPEIEIVGVYAPPFGDALWRGAARDAQRIHESGARIVFVGLGCPRQERWIGRYGAATHAPCLAVGAAFELWAGRKLMAPSWMQRTGLEWLYRLGTEPRRTWRRYLLHNPSYALLAANDLLRRSGRR